MAEPRTSIPGEADPSFFVSYIDAREQRISQPADLARALQKAASNLKSRMLYAMQLGLFNLAKANFGNLTFSLDPVGKAVSGQQDRTPALAEIIQTYGELLAKFSQGRQNRRSGDARMPWPVLCIDQANQLTAWAEDDRNEQLELDALLNFFVRVTKQDKQCHVILATSDYSFLPWLSKSETLPYMKVTGGNPGLLISAAAEYNGDWESYGHQVLEAMVAANLLAYRPVSDWSRDLPPELHGERCEALVTASSAAHLYAMHILQAAGDFGALPEGQGSEVSGAVPSPDPEMAPVMAALQTVELQIDRIEQKEEKLESEKPEFWREDLRQLRREEEQLRRKKEQLREEELLLLRNQ
ncbi:hypothetical protein COCSUDRAFT_60307 [Coccomyxa subellipsoidea C-169]|uniref:Uncharacterized protein n=1 Tax=Coccomyxa subellipsoidea (strain C-169) TaxID=574566 RepID=I0YIX0_COCSC|nr:hypothetical protein COCSUDRAFT_60307 [Coccomyxa subellipsoidea C-169]EIE18339.1 hypothetical protein COCSUDRAFT_60307 [Coccomyxa subellipsoidea C-169]|eukprot:XP_005642883.1 hypothetical protein COCSUDRAFT_60307 [Coccomyxa subellipsoidea C-169]